MTDLPDTTFALTPTLDAGIRRAAEALVGARHAVALTGAGLSVESGIPPFRGPGGIWTRYGEPPMDGYQRFLRDPAGAWRERLAPREDWMRALGEAVRQAKPNPGHLALAELERRGLLAALITQNIDDLHRQAGHAQVLEIHGNHRLLRCLACNARFEPDTLAIDPDDLPPRCPRCSGIVKGDIVVFGEPIPADVLAACFRAVERADCMLVAGTSATVYPAAEFPYEVLRAGGVVIEVNPDESELSGAATISLRGPGGPVLSRLLEHAARLAPAEAT
ncbi:MAG: NAD-dependent deacylase [Deltaproteobacteria bacterium]|nr:NAD-dependent deacylase [Deltaproteobacteria bacterium]